MIATVVFAIRKFIFALFMKQSRLSKRIKFVAKLPFAILARQDYVSNVLTELMFL